MTYDELYEHITHYVASPHATITENDHRRTCLILSAFMEFILDCQEEGVDANTIDITDFIHEKLDILEGKCPGKNTGK
jgi:hypothetical protein